MQRNLGHPQIPRVILHGAQFKRRYLWIFKSSDWLKPDMATAGRVSEGNGFGITITSESLLILPVAMIVQRNYEKKSGTMVTLVESINTLG